MLWNPQRWRNSTWFIILHDIIGSRTRNLKIVLLAWSLRAARHGYYGCGPISFCNHHAMLWEWVSCRFSNLFHCRSFFSLQVSLISETQWNRLPSTSGLLGLVQSWSPCRPLFRSLTLLLHERHLFDYISDISFCACLPMLLSQSALKIYFLELTSPFPIINSKTCLLCFFPFARHPTYPLAHVHSKCISSGRFYHDSPFAPTKPSCTKQIH